MKVKIRDKKYDAEAEPVLLIFKDPEERIRVANNLLKAHPDCTKYCTFPDASDLEEIEKFMID